METDLHKVLKQKVPYHAHVYPEYRPEMYIKKSLLDLFKEQLQIEEDDDGRPLSIIKRAHIFAGTKEHKGPELSVYCNRSNSFFSELLEKRIRKSGFGIKNFKIFHIWNIKVNGNLGIFPWSAEFQPSTKEIEVEIHNKNEDENDTSKLIINTEDCDKSLIVTVDDCQVNYSVFSDALRVELEIRSYEVDGSPALNFSGNINAHFLFGKTERDITLFHGEYKNEESEAVIRSSLILPRRIWAFDIHMSLVGNAGKFMSKHRLRMLPRSVPIDDQHYILGQDGYVLLTAKWGCCCMDKGLCVCPGTAACEIETFQENYPSSEEENYGESEEDSEESEESGDDEEDSEERGDDEDDRRKRAKMDDDPPV